MNDASFGRLEIGEILCVDWHDQFGECPDDISEINTPSPNVFLCEFVVGHLRAFTAVLLLRQGLEPGVGNMVGTRRGVPGNSYKYNEQILIR